MLYVAGGEAVCLIAREVSLRDQATLLSLCKRPHRQRVREMIRLQLLKISSSGSDLGPWCDERFRVGGDKIDR